MYRHKVVGPAFDRVVMVQVSRRDEKTQKTFPENRPARHAIHRDRTAWRLGLRTTFPGRRENLAISAAVGPTSRRPEILLSYWVTRDQRCQIIPRKFLRPGWYRGL